MEWLRGVMHDTCFELRDRGKYGITTKIYDLNASTSLIMLWLSAYV
jgi:hypothetical protein